MKTWKQVTKFLFGKNAMFGLIDELKNQPYTKAIIITGNNWINSKAINDLIKVLNTINLAYLIYDKMETKPKIKTVDDCLDVCVTNKIDLIFAVGDRGVIEASKILSALVNNIDQISCWTYVNNPNKVVSNFINVIAIPLLPQVGSEANGYSLVYEENKATKKGVDNLLCTPKIAVLDPSYCFDTESSFYACGLIECFCLLIAQYFSKANFDWSTEYIFANLKILVNYGPLVILKPTHLEANANLLWTSSMSANDLGIFRGEPDTVIYHINEAICSEYKIYNGIGLAIILTSYLKIKCEYEKWFKDKLIQLGRNVFKTNDEKQTISFINTFIKAISLPTKWSQITNIKTFDDDSILNLLKMAIHYGSINNTNLYQLILKDIKNRG